MRLWSLHPSYLDTKGLLAAWREALLAKKVLQNRTTGYKNHPQLERFKNHAVPINAINTFLMGILTESAARGYNFNAGKVDQVTCCSPIPVTSGQIAFECEHLCKKLAVRDPVKKQALATSKEIRLHPLFTMIEGSIASWEKWL